MLLLMLLLCGAATIPFLWPSTSLWYKFGINKTLLQSGKVAGLSAAILLLVQVLLASRPVILDRVFGLDRVYLLHQINGFLIIGLVLTHFSLVIIPEGLQNLPIGWKFWPEMIGAATLLMLISTVTVAKFRRKLLPYHLWRELHRPVGYLLLATMVTHVLTVSDSFKQGVPRLAFFAVASFFLLGVVTSRLRSIRQARSFHSACEISELSEDVVSLRTAAPPSFAYAPGQFAFLRLSGSAISSEPHPFTIASAPHGTKNPGRLQFMIKRCGDWTARLAPQCADRISIEGPYGLFSYTAKPAATHVVLVAGGIGITPMISMLRQLAAETTRTELLLLWSLHRRSEDFLECELTELKERLPTLRVRQVFTREQPSNRIDRKLLEEMLENYPTTTHFYLCGPEGMMVQTHRHLLSLGFREDCIFRERFAL